MKQICQFCKSEVDSECYKCPICREWIHPFKLSKDNPLLKRFFIIFVAAATIIFAPRYLISTYLLKNFEIKTFQSAQEHHLNILWSKIEKEGKKKIILGELKNDGADSFSSIDIESYFCDKDKKFVKIGNGYIAGNIKPGDVRPFQIVYSGDCGAENNYLNEFESYELKVVNGYIGKTKSKRGGAKSCLLY